MKITPQDVAHIAELAHLDLTAEECTRMERDLNAILDHIDRLNELDTSDVAPMAQIAYVTQAASAQADLRVDESRPSLALEDALRNAPDTDGALFKVPKVIER